MYIAHAGLQFDRDFDIFNKNQWLKIESDLFENLYYRICNNGYIEIVSGPYDDARMALIIAKKIYIQLLYWAIGFAQYPIQSAGEDTNTRFYNPNYDLCPLEDFYKYEMYLFWNKKMQGGKFGPGVFEVEKSLWEIDEYDGYRFEVRLGKLTVGPSKNFVIEKVKDDLFVYDKKYQHILSNLVAATQCYDIGLKMTCYCCILEQMGENELKDEAVVREYDSLIKIVQADSAMQKDIKQQVINTLKAGKYISIRKKCLKVIEKYAEKEYSCYKSKDIFDEAYNIRSNFVHGKDTSDFYEGKAIYMLFLMLDVVKNYIREKQGLHSLRNINE